MSQFPVKNLDDETLEVQVKDKGYIIIKSNDDGVSVDIWTKHGDEPIFTGYVFNDEFEEQS